MKSSCPVPARSGRFKQYQIFFALCGMAAAQAAYAGDGDHFKLGVGAAVEPRYVGSDEYHVQPAPILDYRYGRFYAKSGKGVGFSIIDTPSLTVGAGVSWMSGYRSEDVPDGIGKLSDALGGRLSVSTHLADVELALSVTQAITKSERGLLANVRLSYPYAITDSLKLIPSVAVNWANAKYMDSYYGISADQSARSGLAQYSPSAGIRDVSVRLAVSYDINKRWSVVGAVGASRLLGDAADSPLVKRESQFQGVVGIAYTF